MAATKTAALDHLIDVLAGENIETRGTVATVIDTLASLIEDGTIVIGGGGGGDDSVFVVTFTTGEGDTIIADKTAAEILAAVVAGKAALGVFYGTVAPCFGADAEHGAAFVMSNVDGFGILSQTMFIIAPDDTVTQDEVSYDLSSLA